MSNKTLLLNSAFGFSSDDTQPHSIIVNYLFQCKAAYNLN